VADKVDVCMCEKCGNEAEMNISFQLSQVQTPYGEIWKGQKETRTCKVCGNEAETIIDLGD
jgi:transcription elongation factor Elf1